MKKLLGTLVFLFFFTSHVLYAGMLLKTILLFVAMKLIDKFWRRVNRKSVKGEIVLITGAASGIGKLVRF